MELSLLRGSFLGRPLLRPFLGRPSMRWAPPPISSRFGRQGGDSRLPCTEWWLLNRWSNSRTNRRTGLRWRSCSVGSYRGSPELLEFCRAETNQGRQPASRVLLEDLYETEDEKVLLFCGMRIPVIWLLNGDNEPGRSCSLLVLLLICCLRYDVGE